MALSRTLTIRRATGDDAAAVTALIREAITWLAERGTDQWQGERFGHPDRIAASIASGTTWVVDDTTELVATVLLDDVGDPEFWPSDDLGRSSLYVHRMVVARSHAGRGIGAALLDWAGQQAIAQGRGLLRLDAWATNSDLHRYYLGQGFTQVRTLHLSHRGSGALFQRPATAHSGTGPTLSPSSAPT